MYSWLWYEPGIVHELGNILRTKEAHCLGKQSGGLLETSKSFIIYEGKGAAG